MKLNPCGLSEDQFIEIFCEKAKFLGKLLVAFDPGSRQAMEEKLAWEMFQECVYAAEAEAQKIVDPENKNDAYLPELYVSRIEMMDEIKSVNAKVEALVDYLPKPPSLKQQALAVIENSSICDHLSPEHAGILRRAVEQLDG